MSAALLTPIPGSCCLGATSTLPFFHRAAAPSSRRHEIFFAVLSSTPLGSQGPSGSVIWQVPFSAQPRPVSNSNVPLRRTVTTKCLSWHGTGCSVTFLARIPDPLAVPHRLLFGSVYGRMAGVDSEVDLAHIGQPRARLPDHPFPESTIVSRLQLLRLLLSEPYELQERPMRHSILPSGSAMIVPKISVRQQQHHFLTSELSPMTLSIYPGLFFRLLQSLRGGDRQLSVMYTLWRLSRSIDLEARSIARVSTRNCGTVYGQSGWPNLHHTYIIGEPCYLGYGQACQILVRTPGLQALRLLESMWNS